MAYSIGASTEFIGIFILVFGREGQISQIFLEYQFNEYKVKIYYLMILPIALVVTYSQLIVKWRSNTVENIVPSSFLQHLLKFLTDPVILSAYAAALIASFAWLYVVTKLPLTVAFPVYIGVTFAMVLLGGRVFLGEALTTTKIIAIVFIMFGIILGVTADA